VPRLKKQTPEKKRPVQRTGLIFGEGTMEIERRDRGPPNFSLRADAQGCRRQKSATPEIGPRMDRRRNSPGEINRNQNVDY
jgi:hypothetical protein